ELEDQSMLKEPYFKKLTRSYDAEGESRSISSCDSHSLLGVKRSTGMNSEEIEEKERFKNAIQKQSFWSINSLKLLLVCGLLFGIAILIVGFVMSNDIVKKAHSSSIEMEYQTDASYNVIQIAYLFQNIVANVTSSGLQEIRTICTNLSQNVESLYSAAKKIGGNELKAWIKPEKVQLRIFSDFGDEVIRTSSLYEGLMAYIGSCDVLLS